MLTTSMLTSATLQSRAAADADEAADAPWPPVGMSVLGDEASDSMSLASGPLPCCVVVVFSIDQIRVCWV